MDTLIFEWSQRRNIVTLHVETGRVTYYPTMLDMLDNLHEPHRLIGEATFESFMLDRRRKVIERCEAEGHDLLTVPNRLTTKARVAAGFSKKKVQSKATDIEDLHAILWEVQHGVHLKKPRILKPDDPFILKREQANHELMLMRANVRPVIGPRGGISYTDAKDDFAVSLIASLPPFPELPEIRKMALGQNGDYNHVIVAAVGKASQHAEDVKEFDRLAGLYAHGYPSQIRSDLMLHGWAGPTRQKLNENGKRDDLTLSEYRRELRWLYQQLRPVVKANA